MEISAREKKLLIILLALIGGLIIFYGVINPLISFQNSVSSSGASGIVRINELETIYQQYRTLREKRTDIERKLKDTSSVSSLIEQQAATAGISGNRVYNRERETNIQNKIKKITTEVKFEGVGIRPVLEFIYNVENSNKLINVASLRINQAVKERSNYDVTISFENFVMGNGQVASENK